MKLLESAVVVTTLAVSFGPFSATADVCLGMACMYNRMTPIEGIDATLGLFAKEAEKRFAELKTMIDLTQADRVSQKTNLLNRIMDTPDEASGAR
ncbi:hypothetical protein GO003_020115 [Methylicorpusculum oleiharenae]|uniref:hypothetical protein n=1 Tax=Methylicorpusculum oleiharenae TaxID=1338687 RepID=UPI001357C391|nr:hypothetical protein [Methylicorpusculum oleiharenae]MCD2452693.1 hypothetical protein [Methylicorpusculum oleiharenae]